MADQTPANDPLGDRLRTTLRAEHTELERRHRAGGPTRTRTRSSRAWIPMAAVAAAIVIAGFVISGTRADNQAQDLDLAGQPSEPSEDQQLPDTGGGAEPTVTGVIPLATPTAGPEVPTPPPTPVVELSTTDDASTEPLDLASRNACDALADPGGRWFVWGIEPDDPDGGLVGHTAPGIDAPVTRILELDQVVTWSGGCDTSPTGTPWLELNNGDQTDWASGRYLVRALPACLVGEHYGSRLLPEESDNPAVIEAFAYPVEVGDTPASIAAKFNIAIERLVLANPDEDLDLLTAGTNLWIPGQSEDAELAVGPLDGHAIVSDDSVAFVPVGSDRYRWYARDAVGNAACSGGVLDDYFPDDLASRPCAINGATPATSSGAAGSAESLADHVHNLRVEADLTCIRVVVEFGVNAWSDSDGPANLVPEIQVTKSGGSSEIRFTPCELGTGCTLFSSSGQEPQRIDFPGGTAFIAVDADRQPYLQVLADGPRSSITIMENPARLVIDIEPLPSAPRQVTFVAGEKAILRTPIVTDSEVPVLAAGTPITVRGFARPFETIGGWHVFQANSDGSLTSTPTSVASGPIMTTGWTEGWGEFSVDIPGLQPGTYIALFGESPPSAEFQFGGTGQWFVVAGPDDERGPGDFPVISHVEARIDQPILILD